VAGKHPGFKTVAKKIEGEGYSPKVAGAILAKKTRGASPAAKRANPRLKRVKGAIAALVLLFSGEALAAANQAPTGTPVINQGRAGVAVVKSDATVLPATRALYIGDAAACTIAVIFANDFPRGNGAVTLPSVQPGAFLPLSVVKVMSTNTTCASIVALY
jgi:hypothetical protein